MASLSAVIITYNEEKNIGRCLESLKDVADEIVVVDSFSTDKTKEIAGKYDVKFIEHSFEGYIEQKNYAFSLASNAYVLSLDADEALSIELKESIMEEKKDFSADAYSMNRLTSYCGKWIRHCGWYPDRKTRLVNKNMGHWGGTNPHDKMIMDEGAKIDHLNGDLLHYSYYNRQDHLEQIEHFSEIGARELFGKGKKYLWIKIYVSPFAKFVRDYLIKAGFLDGKAGYDISRLSAWATYRKYKKLKMLRDGSAKS